MIGLGEPRQEALPVPLGHSLGTISGLLEPARREAVEKMNRLKLQVGRKLECEAVSDTEAPAESRVQWLPCSHMMPPRKKQRWRKWQSHMRGGEPASRSTKTVRFPEQPPQPSR